MKPEVPQKLLRQAEEWAELHRWERRELGKALRRLGLTYGEIRAIVPVPKSTLATWCAEIQLTTSQVKSIRDRTPSQLGVPRNSQWRRRAEIERIRAQAQLEAGARIDDAFFTAGVVLYWAEGSKTRNDFMLANSDPRALRLFVAWVRQYLDEYAEFVLSLHLHSGNDEDAAKEYWRRATGLRDGRFTKTFVKPTGTGHRKNHLKQGICRVRVMRPADHWNRVMAWIDVVADHTAQQLATIAPGR